MRKWRSENREKNRQNDLRCRVYRLARQKFGENDSIEKQSFVREEIAKRLDRRLTSETASDLNELPFYSGLQQKIELPSLHYPIDRSNWSSFLPELSPTLERRNSTSSSSSSVCSHNSCTKEETIEKPFSDRILPSMHAFMSLKEKEEVIKYVDSNKILDEFVGVVLNYVDNSPLHQK
ncbi:hypothetical protein G6F56_004598 [Rhizopus delemar]|nr:hypothetical protein G6F56_004598 [Rhizopus delemar]